MKVLITSAASRLSQELGASLATNHDVALTDRADVSTPERFVRCDLGHDQSTNELVRGMDVIVHSGEPRGDASGAEQLDEAMRCTYNLLWAASEEGVPRLVYLGSLSVMHRYDEQMAVTEQWRPVPGTEVSVLCYHLGEYVCREFARERKIDVVCLRLGELAWVAGQPAMPSSALYLVDAVQAVERALVADLSGWNIFHIQSEVPDARYLTTEAQKTLGYAPATPR